MYTQSIALFLVNLSQFSFFLDVFNPFFCYCTDLYHFNANMSPELSNFSYFLIKIWLFWLKNMTNYIILTPNMHFFPNYSQTIVLINPICPYMNSATKKTCVKRYCKSQLSTYGVRNHKNIVFGGHLEKTQRNQVKNSSETVFVARIVFSSKNGLRNHWS